MSDRLTALYCRVSAWFARDDGQALMEYALVLALVALVGIVALELLGGNIKAWLLGDVPNI